MEIEKNVLTDDDSDTDYDCDDDDTSSDDDDNFTREFGNIKTKTSCQGKVQIKLDKEEDDDEKEDEEMDDFEAEMEKELAQRVLEAETLSTEEEFTWRRTLQERLSMLET